MTPATRYLGPLELRGRTTGEADAWREGSAWGQRQNIAEIERQQQVIERLRQQVARLTAELDRAPTGLEGRGA